MATAHRYRSISSILTGLLDRCDRWGRLSTTVTRYGSASSTLVVYPPGTSVEQRRRLRAAHAWPSLGLVLLAAVAALALGGGDAAGAAVAVTVGYAVGAVGLARSTARIRHASARASAHVSLLIADGTATAVSDDFDSLARIAAALRRADRELDCGRLTPLEHELVWAAAHQAVATIATAKRQERRSAHD